MKPTEQQVREWAKKAGAKFDPHWGIAYNTGTATFERFAELAARWGSEQARQNWKSDIPVSLLERLSKTLTNLGYATPEGGMEAFGANIEMQLYNLCRGVDSLLKGAEQAQQPPVEEPELPEAVAWVKGLPEGTTHYSAGTPFNECGSAFDVVVRAFKYDDDGDLLVYRTDNDGEYGGWAKAESLFKVVPDTHHLHAFTAAQMHDHFAAGVLVVAALRKDAERYRWLAARATQQADSIGPIFRIDVRRKKDGTPFSLGAAIDAAMQGGQQ